MNVARKYLHLEWDLLKIENVNRVQAKNKLKSKDIQRRRKIINHLECKFIEYDFRKGEFINGR
jgi:hypothetical protein